jgi:hypothetical protein
MRVDPKSEKEIAADGLWPAGEYDFTVLKAEESVSSSGNSMATLVVQVFNEVGDTRNIYDYLVNTPKAQFKVRHFAASVGMLNQYESGNLEADEMVGKSGRLKLRITPEKDNYPAKNTIVDYLPCDEKSPRKPVERKSSAPAAMADLDDDIPF